MSATSNFPVVFRVVDIIPQSDSGETAQNSEPSIAVNPINPAQMIAGTFPDSFFVSTDGRYHLGDLRPINTYATFTQLNNYVPTSLSTMASFRRHVGEEILPT